MLGEKPGQIRRAQVCLGGVFFSCFFLEISFCYASYAFGCALMLLVMYRDVISRGIRAEVECCWFIY